MPGENNIIASDYSYVPAALGALGVALQNYEAVHSFLKSVIPAAQYSTRAMQHAVALGAGGVCSGMVNYKMNMDLLRDFSDRWGFEDYDAYVAAGYFDYKNATPLEQAKYFGGSLIVIVAGVLFGLTAFMFAMGSPLAMLSFMAGLFVTGITMIQELESWLVSWDPKNGPATALPQSFSEWCGYIIAVGNVLALSLMFTLSLAETLILLHVAAVPALAIGVAVSFFFGGFTEYNFYAPYLTALCGQFGDKWQAMMATDWALAGLLCMSVNALVNAAMTYTSLELLTALLISASVALPPVAVITAISVVLTLLAGSASFLLGMNFWIGSEPAKDAVIGLENVDDPQDGPQDEPELEIIPELIILSTTNSTSSLRMFGYAVNDSDSDSDDSDGYDSDTHSDYELSSSACTVS